MREIDRSALKTVVTARAGKNRVGNLSLHSNFQSDKEWEVRKENSEWTPTDLINEVI